jgi:tRNA nucleotidyltransferase (CCA-adding enzyme)
VSGPESRIVLDAPEDVVWIARTLERQGFSTWVVGGAVRDELAGGRAGDWDLTTAARPSDVRRIFRRTVPIGIDHGTVGVIARSGRMYEVTTFRRDIETFGRKARVAFADGLEEDLERRDFTMNAVAWHPITHEVRDPHDGLRDLESKILRTVGDADRRFEEDRLRVLRALRFAGRFELAIEEGTWSAVRRSADKLGELSAERVREELWKVITGQERPSASLRLYATSGVLRYLFPELDRCRGVPGPGGGDLWAHLLSAADHASWGKPIVRLAALLHGVGQPLADDPAQVPARSAAIARNLLRRLKSSNADTDRVTHLIAQLENVPDPTATDADLRRWVRRLGAEYLADMFRLLVALQRARGGGTGGERELRTLFRRSRRLIRSRAPLSTGDLAIDGGDLKALGIPPGPLYGEILRDLLESVTDDPELNRKDVLLRIVSERLDAPPSPPQS